MPGRLYVEENRVKIPLAVVPRSAIGLAGNQSQQQYSPYVTPAPIPYAQPAPPYKDPYGETYRYAGAKSQTYPAISIAVERQSGTDLVPIGSGELVQPGETIAVLIGDVALLETKSPHVVVRDANGATYIEGDAVPTSGFLASLSNGQFFSPTFEFDFAAPYSEGVYELTVYADTVFGFFKTSAKTSITVSKNAPQPPKPITHPDQPNLLGGLTTLLVVGGVLAGLIILGPAIAGAIPKHSSRQTSEK